MIILPRFLVSARRVAEVLNMELSITDGDITSITDNPTIEFKNVSYSYPGSEKETLKDINFKLVPGKTTAIIGGTGSGKGMVFFHRQGGNDPDPSDGHCQLYRRQCACFCGHDDGGTFRCSGQLRYAP